MTPMDPPAETTRAGAVAKSMIFPRRQLTHRLV
eukprot:CAMPEP_0194495586 /NCGR_PEP_ID=MMETSP0253-20130528/13142_1 /TAXON_ID=2966 /ORGANISM="Noctiluca scintillans" /LENGTH=32 /DNA_ID= /DNA_START= /DNA_END= /DNA_ORIENTATION=